MNACASWKVDYTMKLWWCFYYWIIVNGLNYIVPKLPAPLDRSSHSQMFLRIGALKNFATFMVKQLRRSLFLIKLQALCWSDF